MDSKRSLSAVALSPKVVSPTELPLGGRILIEASAGTGKTYTLSLLYLRLLLGIDVNSYSRPLSVDEILVVTFTEAATEELRFRIREHIHQLRIACIRGNHPDVIYQELLSQISDRDYVAQMLQYAEQQMDNAAIYTIHGFCQRILSTNAFDFGVLFEQKLAQDETALRQSVANDFWRQYFYPLSYELAYVIQKIWRQPSDLLKDVTPYLFRSFVNFDDNIDKKSTFESDITLFNQNALTAIKKVKLAWLTVNAQIEAIITNSDVNKRSYSNRYLSNWINEVTNWAQQDTLDYELPANLFRFKQTELTEKTTKGVVPEHTLFSMIDELYEQNLDLKSALLFKVVNVIETGIQQEKQRRSEIGFDDLLMQLHIALKNDLQGTLAKNIAARYPVAMIDEFQDTDSVQFEIFDMIYQNRQQTGLILIGDPKQAIYGFRGADIFTYIQAKSDVDHYFTMDTNWRSSKQMVDSVNQLFEQSSAPFIFDAIPFLSVNAASKNLNKQFIVDDKNIAAMQTYLLPESVYTISEYQQASASHCAEQILQWLNAGREERAWLVDNEQQKRLVTSTDIAILVRTGNEAEIIQQALLACGIRSVYLSNRKSVFDSAQAKEIYWLLQAVLMPENDRYLRTALSTSLFSLNMAEISAFEHQQLTWELIVEEFQSYQTCWRKEGILAMLRQVITSRNIAENILAHNQGERILTNVMHLGELLQEASVEQESGYALLRWFSQQILSPDPNLENQQQRLESDDNLIKIITIHKSKGLEYPIVFLPFISHYRQSDNKIYHDRENYQVHFTFAANDEEQLLIEEERLAEDLRLLYVALTRSIYHCSIGIAGLKNGKNSATTNLHQSAIGYLLQHGKAMDYVALQQQLSSLSQNDLVIVDTANNIHHREEFVKISDFNIEHLTAARFQRKLINDWRVTSYSELQRQGQDNEFVAPILDTLFPKLEQEDTIELNDDIEFSFTQTSSSLESISSLLNAHNLPKGAMIGTQLHTLMEEIDFVSPQWDEPLNKMLSQLALPEEWFEPVKHWLDSVLASPLNDLGLALNQISEQQKLIELPFYLPIRQSLDSYRLAKLCQQYDPLSAECPALAFNSVQGMLKGFVDLVFEWQGKYYIADYKSNWLGDNITAYTAEAIAEAMCEHRYDLQYQFYALALHRYLKHRLPYYNYQTHFGGVYYLFLRGMDKNLPQNGIYFNRPNPEFIDKLDQLFGVF